MQSDILNPTVLDALTDHDVATLAQWATNRKLAAKDDVGKKAYSLLREGADLLLRHRHLGNGNASK